MSTHQELETDRHWVSLRIIVGKEGRQESSLVNNRKSPSSRKKVTRERETKSLDREIKKQKIHNRMAYQIKRRSQSFSSISQSQS